ncbi:PepSY domain-containing protein [Sphingomonas sp. MG17]|uniref:PepSY domain-containing protein n=1 Tax=Sphingomonas tagetis TaxID=2949092 RepID=A0A9X2KLF3_9SPHN|nr:PepSY-associated TM helix domain-containing protein [Sphingomonas tagetis]MCP3731484.1 PepSY domain-containing protein [Sphingomonas tagetis]
MLSRARWLRFHRIAGLGIAAFLLVQAVTGALLVFAGPAARAINPAGMTSRGQGQSISAGAAVERAGRAMPGYHVTRVFAPDGPGAVWMTQLSDEAGRAGYVSIDPAGGAVLRAGGLLRFPVETALQIHYQLVAGKAGMVIIALNGLALLFMAVSGVAYWWPKRNPAKALAIRCTLAPRLVLRQAHRTLGVVAAAFLMILATTGLMLVIPEIAASAAPAPPATVTNAAAVDRGLALAQARFPASRLRDARIAGERLIVNFHAPERNARAVHRAVVSLAHARLISATPADRNTALWMTVLPIHAGDVLGTVGRILLLLVALALGTLAVSGPIMWWHVASQRRGSVRKAAV